MAVDPLPITSRPPRSPVVVSDARVGDEIYAVEVTLPALSDEKLRVALIVPETAPGRLVAPRGRAGILPGGPIEPVRLSEPREPLAAITEPLRLPVTTSLLMSPKALE